MRRAMFLGLALAATCRGGVIYQSINVDIRNSAAGIEPAYVIYQGEPFYSFSFGTHSIGQSYSQHVGSTGLYSYNHVAQPQPSNGYLGPIYAGYSDATMGADIHALAFFLDATMHASSYTGPLYGPQRGAFSFTAFLRFTVDQTADYDIDVKTTDPSGHIATEPANLSTRTLSFFGTEQTAMNAGSLSEITGPVVGVRSLEAGTTYLAWIENFTLPDSLFGAGTATMRVAPVGYVPEAPSMLLVGLGAFMAACTRRFRLGGR